MSNKFKSKIAVLVFIFVMSAFCQSAMAIMANPAAEYCTALGYQWKMKTTPVGDVGLCVLPDGTEVDEWNFVTGKTGEKYNYCSQKGYKTKLLSSDTRCDTVYSSDCSVCVLADGNEVEATKLMALESPPGNCKGPFCFQIKKSTSSLQSQKSLVNSTNTNVKSGAVNNKNLLFIICGAFLFVVLLIVAIIYYVRKRKRIDDNDIENSKPIK
jgi:uncharacterized protein